MEIHQFYRDALKIFEDGRSVLQSEMADVDRAIEQLRKENSNHTAIAMIEPGRVKLQAQINELNVEIERIQTLANGKPATEGAKAGHKLRKGQYEGVRKLSTAVQMFLMHCVPGGGPIRVSDLTEELDWGGTKVQVRNGKDRGKRKPVDAKHIRIMAADYKTGFSSKGLTSPFVYDKTRDMISLRSEDAVEQVKAKGKSSSGREWSSATSSTGQRPFQVGLVEP